MTEKERMLAGKIYCPFKVGDNTWEKSREVLEQFNSMPWQKEKERMELLRSIFGHLEEDAVIVPPFYCDKGTQIYIGKHFYANTGLLILDEADVRIGDHVFIAPRVCIYTAGHPLDIVRRNKGLEYARPITIGDNVWIGGNVAILPGVTIGEGAVIGAGSVVTKDIPPYALAYGNPCRVIRRINQEETNDD